MKIPYVKLYTADLLAASRYLTSQQIGDAILALCESAFENDTAYTPDTAREQAFFNMLLNWKEEAQRAYKQNKKVAQKAARARWKKQTVLGGAPSISGACATGLCQTETETKTETETDTETETENINIFTAQPQAAQGASTFLIQPKTPLQRFALRVLEHFEPHVKTTDQKIVWFKRHCRELRDILQFCGGHITLALQTIDVCLTQMEKSGLPCGYAGVLRNIPEYYAKAQEQLPGSPYAR